MSQVPVYMIGGSSLFRRGLGSFFEDTNFKVAGEFNSNAEFLALHAGGIEPGLVVYSASDEAERTCSDIIAIKATSDPMRVLVMSTELSIEELGLCLQAGACGYLLSNISKEVFSTSMRLIELGEAVFPSQLAAAWGQFDPKQANRALAELKYDLTKRESEILHTLTLGDANKVIAQKLGIAESTVKIHVKGLLRKIGVQNRTQAATWAIHAGFSQSPSRTTE